MFRTLPVLLLAIACNGATTDDATGDCLAWVDCLYAIDAEEKHCVLSLDCDNDYFFWKTGMKEADLLPTSRV